MPATPPDWTPYTDLGDEAFWKSAVATRHPLSIRDLWTPKFDIRPTNKVATAGSCFAQHISRALQASGYSWYNGEPAPSFVDEATARRFNYGVYSFRTGNIYTAAALHQWARWGTNPESAPDAGWITDRRHYDPFRPAIEPGGFSSKAEMLASRALTLKAVNKVMRNADYFVFTLGLTEGWRSRQSGDVYAMCPGTVAGRYDAKQVEFHNFTYEETKASLIAAFKLMRRRNPNMRFILTVSPVPLTATASGKHILAAATYSKSVLRAVAGALADEHDFVDYFPSYEIITGIPFRSMFFQPNLREVAPEGVEFVMKSFFAGLHGRFGAPEGRADKPPTTARPRPAARAADDLVCEEQMLEAFGAAA